MDKDGCGYGGIWNIYPYVTIVDAVLSVYHQDYLQGGLCTSISFCSSCIYCSLDQVEESKSASRPSQMVLSRIWNYVGRIQNNVDGNVQ